MVTFEQVKLLETKIARAIDFVDRVTEENALLRGKLETYQKRIGELEVLIQRFKDDQGRIEEGIISALDRLNRFEAAIEQTLAPVSKDDAAPGVSPKADEEAPPEAETAPEVSGASSDDPEEPEASSEIPDNIYAAEQPEEPLIFDPEAEESADLGVDDVSAPAGDGTDSAELDIF
jgi:chromosome segregation ATPase